jgi:hypothetical protein
MGPSTRRATFRYAAAGLASLAVSWLSWHVPGTIDVETYWLPLLAAVSRYGLIEGYAVASGDYPPGTATHLFVARRLLPTADDMTVLKALLAAAQLGATRVVIALAIFANLYLAVFYGLSGTPPLGTGPAFAWLTGILSAFSLLLFAYVLSRLAVARRIVE